MGNLFAYFNISETFLISMECGKNKHSLSQQYSDIRYIAKKFSMEGAKLLWDILLGDISPI